MFPSLCLGFFNGPEFVAEGLAGDLVQVDVEKQFPVFAFDDVFVGDFMETTVNELVVISNEELSETRVPFGTFGKVILISAVAIGFESERHGFCLFRITRQRFELDHMCESLDHNRRQYCQEAQELYQEMALFFHGLESEIDEWVKVGYAKGSYGDNQQHKRYGKHRPRECFGIMLGKDGVLQAPSTLGKGNEGE